MRSRSKRLRALAAHLQQLRAQGMLEPVQAENMAKAFAGLERALASGDLRQARAEVDKLARVFLATGSREQSEQ